MYTCAPIAETLQYQCIKALSVKRVTFVIILEKNTHCREEDRRNRLGIVLGGLKTQSDQNLMPFE